MTESAETGGVAARLRDVLFSYDRDADLDDEGSDDSVDPDSRGGAVLRGVDLDVPAGEVVVVMGASGGGKSTLLRTLNALIPGFLNGAFDGDVEVLGRDATATKTSDLAEQVGTVMQDYEAQLFGTSVEAEVAFGPENLAVPPEEIGPRIDRALSQAGLGDLDRRREPAGLSGGQKQRLVFASVLAMRPELLVLDEPTSDLDPLGARNVVEIVRSLADASDGPETIVLVTHEIEEALLADSAVLLKDGRVFRQGPTESVFTDVAALRESRVELPPVVDAFDRLGWDREQLPVTVAEAADRVEQSDLTWEPPEPTAPAPAGSGGDPGEVRFAVEGARYSYDTDRGPVTAVDGVDLEIRAGEVVAIVGHNGSGKTTLAKQLNGLFDPDDGRVSWRGRDVREYDAGEIGREVGFVFQNPDHQIFEDTVRDEVAFGPKNFGIEGEELDARVADAIETVDLGSLADADPFALSKGQRQRVALASILATRPSAIVFDEPTTGLDAEQQVAFMDLVARLNREEGLTVVMVTHDMGSVARYAPRTVVMADGRKVADRSTRELFADPEALDRWQLDAPQPVALSNELAARAGREDALPALTVEEVVAGLGGEPAADDPVRGGVNR
ncbi:ABC transporter ATP-binding protein [Halorussus marinus]|uniref:ABC transporter ATP-binding protein n=1 Tax=Halorussus marinus TaxID=2505976 RepID=UPI00106E069F|nr:energy-coupling factor transporter ATPase [Halorussus marinus]